MVHVPVFVFWVRVLAVWRKTEKAIRGMRVSIKTITSNVDLVPTHMGARLGAARIAAGLSLKDAAQKINLQYKYLDAIERLDKDVLPGLGYTLGYVRTYARLLGLNEQDVIARFKADMAAFHDLGHDLGHDLDNIGNPRYVPKRSIRLPRGSFAIGAVLACVLVIVSWYGMKADARSSRPDIAPVVQADNRGLALVQPAKRDTDMIALKAIGPSWVQVRDGEGRTLISRIMVPGEIFETSRKNLPILSLRDAGAIELYLGGNRLGLIGQPGHAAKNIPLAEVGLQ